MLASGFALILLTWGVCAQEEDPIIAFTARLTTDIKDVTTSTILVYTETTANSGNWFNTDTGGFQVPPGEHGVYYMSQSIGTPEGKWCNTNVFAAGTGLAFSGLKIDNFDTDNVEFSSRGYMQEVTAEQTTNAFEVRGNTGCSLIGDPYLTTTWSAFRYGETTDVGVAFSVARFDEYFGGSESINWNMEFVNVGGPGNTSPMNTSTGFFRARFHGYYFFHMSAMSVSGSPLIATMFRWPAGGEQVNNICALNRTSTNIVGTDTTGRSMFVELWPEDQVTMANMPGSGLGSSIDGLELSFSGFGYGLTVLESDETIAFGAYMSNWWWNEPVTQVISNWTDVTVNVNGDVNGEDPFDLLSGDFKAPMAGTYFLSFSVGVNPNMRCIAVMADSVGYEVARIDRRNSRHNGVDTLSRDLVVDLVPGHVLRIQAGSGSSLFASSTGREVSFMGMRLRHLPDGPPDNPPIQDNKED